MFGHIIRSVHVVSTNFGFETNIWKMSLKLTDELDMEMRMMGQRGFEFHEMAYTNYPYSYNTVMRFHKARQQK